MKNYIEWVTSLHTISTDYDDGGLRDLAIMIDDVCSVQEY